MPERKTNKRFYKGELLIGGRPFKDTNKRDVPPIKDGVKIISPAGIIAADSPVIWRGPLSLDAILGAMQLFPGGPLVTDSLTTLVVFVVATLVGAWVYKEQARE
jgi:hypothetical protein